MTSKYNPCEESESIVIVFDLDCRCTMLRRCWLIWKRILRISGLSLHVVVFLSMDNLQCSDAVQIHIHCYAFSIKATFSGVIYKSEHFGAVIVIEMVGVLFKAELVNLLSGLPCVSTHSLCCRCVVSGAGKVALYAVEKLITFGAIPVTISGKFVWFLG